MDTPFTSIQHFYVRETRAHNVMNGQKTIHPFACIVIGFCKEHSPHPLGHQFRVTAMMIPRHVTLNKEMGLKLVYSLMQANPEHNHTGWFTKEEMLQTDVKNLMHNIGFKWGILSSHTQANWDAADKSYYNVVLDAQGLRFNEKGDIAPRASRRDDPKPEMSEHDKRFGADSLIVTK